MSGAGKDGELEELQWLVLIRYLDRYIARTSALCAPVSQRPLDVRADRMHINCRILQYVARILQL